MKNTIKKDENGKIDYSDLKPSEKAQLDEVMNALGDIKDKMNFEPYVDHKKLSKLY